MTVRELTSRWDDLKKDHPKLRIKNAAEKLQVSELELVHTLTESTPLQKNWADLFKGFESLGYVMALTRNDSVVHERKGHYQKISFNGHVGLVLDKDIDLRIFPGRIEYAYAVPVKSPKRELLSIQFFDAYGYAVHKVYVMNEDHIQDYHNLVENFRIHKEDHLPEIKTSERPGDYEYSDSVDVKGFLEEWSGLEDTHDFFPLLKKYKIERTQALAIAEGRFTTKVENDATERMLEMVAEQKVPIMVFVSSGAVIQIHSGEVENIRKMDNWLNILDSEFNLHLREDHIANTWIVEKPTEDGIVTSLEIFDADNNNIATFFGARKPGNPELKEWKSVMDDLEQESELV